MPLREARQLALARHLRDPDTHAAPPDLEDRRVGIYRELLINNVTSLLGGTFPVIRRLLGDEGWRALVRRFYAMHESHTPLFYELGSEFVRFLGEHPELWGDRPFLHELAHYEWVELALELADAELPDIDPAGDLIAGVPASSPFAWLLGYRFPVHQIRLDFQPTEAPAQASWLLVYRNPADQVQFQALEPLAARLLALVQEDLGATGSELVRQLAGEAGMTELEPLLANARALLEGWRARGVILGTRR
jgi:hypothetical protein